MLRLCLDCILIWYHYITMLYSFKFCMCLTMYRWCIWSFFQLWYITLHHQSINANLFFWCIDAESRSIQTEKEKLDHGKINRLTKHKVRSRCLWQTNISTIYKFSFDFFDSLPFCTNLYIRRYKMTFQANGLLGRQLFVSIYCSFYWQCNLMLRANATFM